MTITLDHVQTLANQLSPRDQARLIEHLFRQIAPSLTEVAETSTTVRNGDALTKLAQLRAELAALPAERLASEQ